MTVAPGKSNPPRLALPSQSSDPISLIGWLPGQVRYFCRTSKYTLLRAGNQSIGKTWALLADILLFARGIHPWQKCSQASSGMIVCVSWKQSLAIQEKLKDLCPEDWVVKTSKFATKGGWTGVPPTVEIHHVSGGVSIVRFATGKQKREDLAGSTLDWVVFDEPPDEASYRECRKRVMAKGGWLSVAMTPIDDKGGKGCLWLRDNEVADGRMVDMQVRLEPHELKSSMYLQLRDNGTRVVPLEVPPEYRMPYLGPDGRPRDEAWVHEVISGTPAVERGITCHGDWRESASGAYYQLWTGKDTEPTKDQWLNGRLLLGIDHGDRPGKQVAVLCLMAEPGPLEQPYLWVLDEYRPSVGNTTSEEDAAGILSMLRRWGWSWSNLHYACGDRDHRAQTANAKGNSRLARHLIAQLGFNNEVLKPRLNNAKQGEDRGAGSLAARARSLHDVVAKDRLFVLPTAPSVRASLLNWDGESDDHWKDPLDALFYALNEWTFRKIGPAKAGPKRWLRR